MLRDGLPAGLQETDLPHHHRGRWTMDQHLPAPGGGHVLTLFAINEETLGHMSARAGWSVSATPAQFIGTVERLPLMPWAHWIDTDHVALKLNAYHRDWVRPMVIFDLAGGFSVVPYSNGAVPDFSRLDQLRPRGPGRARVG